MQAEEKATLKYSPVKGSQRDYQIRSDMSYTTNFQNQNNEQSLNFSCDMRGKVLNIDDKGMVTLQLSYIPDPFQYTCDWYYG